MTTVINENKSMRRFAAALEQFRELDPNIQATTILIFVVAAGNQGITARELAQATGISEASLSRNLASLSETHRSGGEGLNLLTRREDPTDARNKRIYLKERGVSLYKRILALTGD